MQESHAQFQMDETRDVGKLPKMNPTSNEQRLVSWLQGKPFEEDEKGVSAFFVTFTPELAKYCLACNYKNRRLSSTNTSAYVRDMTQGKWIMAGDPIKFTSGKIMFDGQHRLYAAIDAKQTLTFLVVINLSPEAIYYNDMGRKRSAGDMFDMQGKKYATRLAAACRSLEMLKHHVKDRVTVPEILSINQRHPQIEKSVEIVEGAKGISPSILAMIHYVGTHLLDKQDQAESFVNAFKYGVAAYYNDPAILWRDRTLTLRKHGAQQSTLAMFNGSIYVWNKHAKGETLKHLRLPEKPIIDGLDLSKI